MGHLEWLILPIIVLVWIVQHLLRGSEEDGQAKRTRPFAGKGPGEERPRRQASEIDRFLEEVNRRRRQAEERRQTPSTAQPAPAPVLPPVTPRSPRPVAPVRPSPSVARPAAPPVRPAARRATLSRGPAQEPVVAVEVAAVSALREEAPAEVVAVQLAQDAAAFSTSPGQAQPAPLTGLARFLEKPEDIRDVLVWREILGPPGCRRRGFP